MALLLATLCILIVSWLLISGMVFAEPNLIGYLTEGWLTHICINRLEGIQRGNTHGLSRSDIYLARFQFSCMLSENPGGEPRSKMLLGREIQKCKEGKNWSHFNKCSTNHVLTILLIAHVLTHLCSLLVTPSRFWNTNKPKGRWLWHGTGHISTLH